MKPNPIVNRRRFLQGAALGLLPTVGLFRRRALLANARSQQSQSGSYGTGKFGQRSFSERAVHETYLPVVNNKEE